MRPWILGLAALVALGCGAPDETPATSEHASSDAMGVTSRLVVDGRRIVDPSTGETVVLRGVNLAGDAKVPPFLPFRPGPDGKIDGEAIDRHFEALGARGFNSVRLTFYWEAYEGKRGAYDETYLERFVEIAARASRKSFYVIVDVHQDLFSRHAGKGCGSGFPRWTVPERYRAAAPLNPGVGCGQAWSNEVLAEGVTESFAAFYRNERGVRDAYLTMLEHVMARVKDIPGVLGLDPLNEPIYNPWTDLGGASELGALYRDAAARVRAIFPDAIMFLEGHIWTNNGGVFIPTTPFTPAIGMPVTLPRPDLANVVYAPHVYHVDTMRSHRFKTEDRRFVFSQEFENLANVGRAWNVPVWIGEFGIFADTASAPEYFDTFYARMNAWQMHGAVWNDSPHWGEDGPLDDRWNSEDLSLFDGRTGTFRSFYRASAFVERIAGTDATVTDVQDSAGGPRTLKLEATADVALAKTVIYLPRTPRTVSGSGVTCKRGSAATGGEALVCTADGPGRYWVSVAY